ncbi:inorganic phosphate transporter [Gordonia sp. w5E2]|uniref:Phosphate transporter n=1 Tax=Gordonia jacobaea TaxID=122202 RepID=A0ABR5ID49_9ACTN|nr:MULTISPECIES: inorganic phosphate transporter [Gordonia]KNA91570.1 phosphate transporter [Gordonia jacobaea]OBC04025.1 phosphate transporter [Gordonia sp. 852002-50816_SCH5313054-a]OBC12666.1 phosphate transporter [Gordonia sp. 852002-50816_SCH5313054-c]
MDLTTLAVVGIIALAALFDFTNGFHDSANSIATVVATHVLKPKVAVVWAAGWNFLAFFVIGTAVADTVGETVKSQYYSVAVVFAALLAAVIWNFLSWHLGIPTSSSHALIGGLIGAALVKGGIDAIKASSVEKTAAFIVISPLAGLLLGGALMLILRAVLFRAPVLRTEKLFRWFQLASSGAISLAHGGNDAQKTMGIVAGLLVSTGHLTQTGSSLPVPDWVALGCYLFIALGTLSGGWRIVRTMGTGITRLRPVSGFCAETGAAIALFGSTALGAPVSTTHTVAGAVAGVGTTNRNSTVDWSVFRKMVVAWVVTMPAAAIVAAAVYGLTQLPSLAASTIVLAVLIAGLLVLLWKSLRAAPTASDVEADLDKEAEEEFPMLAGAGSIIPSGKPRRPHAHTTESDGDADAPGKDDAKAAKEAEQRKQLEELNKVTADQVPELSW